MQLQPLQQYNLNKEQQFKNESLKQICRSMLKADEKTVAETQEQLRKLSVSELGSHAYILELLPRLQDQYGKTDNGSLVALICMNFLTFQPGEVIFIPADGIHTYLAGDIVECMARSDNVINNGFCPRAERDSIDLFTEALTFKQHHPKEPVLERVDSEFSAHGKTTAFKTPMSEFNRLITEMKSGDRESIRPISGPSVMIVTSGKGKMTSGGESYDADEGYIYFIGCNTQVDFETDGEFTAY